MDEVDIDNVEDLNELEARLYAQIHHEATNEANTENNNGLVFDAINKDTLEQNYETSSNTNIILSRRYWANAKTSAKIPQHNSKQRFIRNPFKTPNQQEDRQIKVSFSNKSQIQQTKQQKSKQSENQSNASLISSKTNEQPKSTQKNSDLQTEKTTPSAMKNTISSDTESISHSSKSEQSTNAKQKVPAVKSNLKLNPVANWMERKKNQNKNANNVNGKNSKNSTTTTNSKQGPFARQQEKLQKAKRIEEKKQKSKKARNTAAAIASKIKPYEIIDLETESDSDSSDVIVIPIAPPPTYTVDDSDDEKDKVSIVLGHEENALDSTDVQMSSTSGSFIKPQSIQNADCSEKRLENSSRCTSPCSIQSSDDFIGQTDRSRLLVGASDMADDEDLLVLTTDINSLLWVPEVPPKQIVHDDVDTCVDKEEISLGQNVDQEPAENMKNNDSLEFVTPETSKAQSQKHDYRVDQGLFRALDVYESESDITDSVYTKGAKKATVIRQIDNSSDEIEVISSCSQRTKRLRKRRASSGNKESDPNNENSVSSSDNEDVDREALDDNKVLRTAIPFIAKGPAVECYKPKKRRQTMHSCSPNTLKHKSLETPKTSGNMSDTKFIATLNNLAQGQEGEQLEQDEEDESEIENAPTARDIAEKILAQHNKTEENKKSSTEDMAVPEALLDELDKVFETIDQMDEQETNKHRLSSPEDTVKISDSSDSDREKHFIYKSLPNEEAQVIKYSPPTSQTQEKSRNKNCSPIYNVIYSRGQRKPGGMGWNDEMRKFYNESWNGEYFSMNKILQKMNPDKNLWKIYTEDRFSIKLNKRSNIKCTNCCEFGHIRSRCKKPRKPLICYMCGDSGHHEPRCPNTICLRCGKKTQVFTKSCNVCSFQNRLICPICKIRGHTLDYCPDKWRRYHSTTEANTYPNSNIEYNPRKYCCICGARGHLSDNCRSAVRFLEYPPIVSTVKSHQKSYSDVVVKTPHNGIALNLMYEPCQEYKFCLVAKTSSNKYYGRFLKAVGLDYLLKRKRHISAVASEVSDTTAKKTKRLSKKYEANPYSKIGTANQKNIEADENAPNQVQEITESGSSDQQDKERRIEEDIINIEDNNDGTAGSDNEIELIGSTVGDEDVNIQLNTTNEKTAVAKHHDENFKSPENVKSTTSFKSQTEPPVILDSDSNYSFSEHFDVASTSGELPLPSTENPIFEQKERGTSESCSRPKPRQMEALPDFIPLNNSTEEQNQQNSDNEYPDVGISRRFVATISEYDEDEEMENNRRNLSPLPELPCEAKIYLTHLHSIYLLSPIGNTFLVKTSRAHKLKARLDFTSIGHVLVIFGLPRNQDNFQRELLLKFRELEAEDNQKHVQSNFNVPKRIDVLIRFLRENINLLLNNLGNVNHLLKRLQFLERQQSKSGYKLAEKVRRSLNMILVGQAGLQDGSMHLDKLLVSLKTLINDYNSKDFTPPELRSEITDHWKVIFSSYRHENYQRLVDAYNRLISKNRMPKLVIDPILLGQKVLDVSLSEEQKQTLEQARTAVASLNLANYTDAAKQIVPNPLNQKNTKPLKRKQNAAATNTKLTSPSTAQDSAKAKTPSSRSHTPTKTLQTETPSTRAENSTTLSNVKAKATINNTSSPLNSNKTSTYTGTPSKTKTMSTTIHAANKSKQSTSTTNTTSTTPSAANANLTKKQPQKLMPPPPFANPEKRSNVTTSIQNGTDQLKSTCDSLLTEISSDKKVIGSGKVRDSKLPSTFWSREAMRYLLECLHLAAAQPSIVEKLKRVENKSKRGQLSYNDYLAVIKLHTALKEK